MSYRKIILQALDITFRYKFLWFLGLFLFITQGAVILTAQHARENEPVSLKKAWDGSKRHVAEVIGLNLVAACLLLFTSAILLAPPYFLSELGMPSKAILLTVMAFIILVPLLMIIFFSSIFGAAFIVLGNMHLRQALRSGFELCLRNWLLVLPLGVFALLINTAFGFLASSAFTALTVFAVLILGAMLSAWQTVLWTLAWIELVSTEKTKKSEEKLIISEATAVD